MAPERKIGETGLEELRHVGSTTGGATTPTGGTVVSPDASLDQQLQDLLDGDLDTLPPSCPTLEKVFANPTRPARIFVRAEVRNQVVPDMSAFRSDLQDPALPPCVRRVAYTNPVWVKVEPCEIASGCFLNETAGVGGGGVGNGGGSGGSTTVNPALLGQIVGTATTATGVSGTTNPIGGLPGTMHGTLTTTSPSVRPTTSLTPTRSATVPER